MPPLGFSRTRGNIAKKIKDKRKKFSRTSEQTGTGESPLAESKFKSFVARDIPTLKNIKRRAQEAKFSPDIEKSPERLENLEQLEAAKQTAAAPTPEAEEIKGIDITPLGRSKSVGDTPSTDLFEYKYTNAEGKEITTVVSREQHEALQAARRTGEVRDESVEGIAGDIEDVNIERSKDIKALALQKEAESFTDPLTPTPFETPASASWLESAPNILSWQTVKNPLTAIRPQARRNVSTVKELATDMETYAKERLMKGVRDGGLPRSQALYELKTMRIVAHEMRETILREKDVPVVGKALEDIDNVDVQTKTILLLIDDALAALMAMPAEWDTAQRGALGRVL